MKLLVRSKYSDILATEDPTIKSSDTPPSKSENEKGASFSFTRNYQSKSSKWQVTGAAILPITFRGPTVPDGSNWCLESWGFIPSVSLNEVKDEDKPSNDVDSLIYRAGMFAQLFEPNIPGLDPYGSVAHQFRGYFSYGTDLHHKSGIPAGEFEWEPQINFGDKIALGYKKALIWRPEAKDHPVSIAEDALLAYQLRVYLHGEFGEVTRSGDKPIPEQSFSRLGPAVELSLDPFFMKDLALTVSYRYYDTLSGFGDVAYLFDSSLAWTLWKDPDDKSHKVTLKGGYTEGGQDLTQLREKLTTLGFGVTF